MHAPKHYFGHMDVDNMPVASMPGEYSHQFFVQQTAQWSHLGSHRQRPLDVAEHQAPSQSSRLLQVMSQHCRTYVPTKPAMYSEDKVPGVWDDTMPKNKHSMIQFTAEVQSPGTKAQSQRILTA